MNNVELDFYQDNADRRVHSTLLYLRQNIDMLELDGYNRADGTKANFSKNMREITHSNIRHFAVCIENIVYDYEKKAESYATKARRIQE